MKREITPEQIVDWTENPTTIALKELIDSELDAIKDTAVTNCLVVGSPIKSHENLIELEVRERAWDLLAEFLDGDWSYLEEEEQEND